MMLKYSRRQFLGASFALSCLPAIALAKNSEDVVARMAIMSDVHFSGDPNAKEVERLRKALAFMYEYSGQLSYSKFDALFVAGDMTNHGYPNELDLFKKEMDAGIKPGTQKIICMGNHEFHGGSKALWEKTFQVKGNARYEVNGFQVITLSPDKGNGRNGDYLYAKDWLCKQLEESKALDPKKPIFVIQHYHITDTVYGSLNGDNWGIKDLDAIFKDYPMVIDFSGHSHYPINDPRSIWQGIYTAVNTGTLSYFEMEGGHYDKFPQGYQRAAQMYVMEVYKDNSVVLKPYDILSGSFFDIVYLIAEPGNMDKYLYTNARYQTAKPPWWVEGTSVAVESIEPFGATLLFDQAKDAEAVHSYRFDFEKKEGAVWKPFCKKYAWSEYYFKPMPKKMKYVVDELDELSEYRVSITALNAFGKESAKTIHAEFKTLKDTFEENIDKTAAKPQANVLDITFSEAGAKNAPTNNFPTQKAIEKHGSPKIVQDAVLGAVAAFAGSDFYKVKFSAKDYGRMCKEVTIMAQFKTAPYTGKETRSIFSNTEGGGYSLEINQEKKSLEFWMSVGGKYIILSTPIEPGVWYSAYGVYDGKKVVLYLNGKKVAEQTVKGKITYTSIESARAFCVGADIERRGGGNACYVGQIAVARLFSWALSEVQIKNLSQSK